MLQGHYWVDVSGCWAWNGNYVGYNAYDSSCFCVIKGNVYYDINGNCLRDPGEPGIHHIQIRCSGYGYTYTDDSGNYSFLVPSGTYTITETIRAFYPLPSCQSNNIVVSAVATSGCVLPVDFANSINPIHSIYTSLWDYNFAIPGHTYTQKLVVANNGTVTETDMLGGYKNDGQFFGAAISPGGIYTLDSTNYYTTNAGGTGLSMEPGEIRTFSLDYNVPTFVPLGTNVVFKDSATYTAPMSTWLTDYTPWNNVNYFSTTVVSSFDPNFKEVNPKGVGPHGIITYADSNLKYMVHFQNTGTYMAENITVIDTLDPNLNWASLEPVYESAPCKITLSPTGVATFTFNHINLPPAGYSNAPSSDGMFTYSIKTRSGLPIGTQFKNSASIYFDYNAPVKTNTTVNTLVSYLNVNEPVVTENFFYIYPNPATSSFVTSIISTNETTALFNITDITGRTLYTNTVLLHNGSQSFTTSTNQLKAGIYFVSVNLDGRVQTQKLVITK